MVKYASEIIQILESEKITCHYIAVEEVVNGFYNDGETVVRSFFICGFPHKLMSYSICAKRIPAKNEKEVGANLLEINKRLQTGYFYFDEDSQCIAYYNEIKLPQQPYTAALKSEVLEKFCRWSYEAFQHYRDELY